MLAIPFICKFNFRKRGSCMIFFKFRKIKIHLWIFIGLIISNYVFAANNDKTTVSITPKYYFACDNDGNVMWKKLFTEQIKFADHWNTNNYLVGKYNNSIFVFNVHTGENLWVKTESYRILFCGILGDTVILGTLRNNLCYDATTGKLLKATKYVNRRRNEEIANNCNGQTYSYDYFKETKVEFFRGIVTTSTSICGFDIDANRIYNVPVEGGAANIFTTGGKKKEDHYAVFFTNKKGGIIVISTYSGEVAWRKRYHYKIVNAMVQQRLFGKHRLKLTFLNGDVKTIRIQNGDLINE